MRRLTGATVEALRPLMGFLLATLVAAVLVVGAFLVGGTRSDVVVNLEFVCLGFAMGTCVGTALSPADQKEEKRFAGYGKAIVAFATGYAASKLGDVATAVLASPAMADPSPTILYRLLAVATMTLVSARTTFTCRSYD